jgi:hypothetical protein
MRPDLSESRPAEPCALEISVQRLADADVHPPTAVSPIDTDQPMTWFAVCTRRCWGRRSTERG